MVIQGPSWRQDWIAFFYHAFFRGWTRELMSFIYKNNKSSIEILQSELFGLGFSTTIEAISTAMTECFIQEYMAPELLDFPHEHDEKVSRRENQNYCSWWVFKSLCLVFFMPIIPPKKNWICFFPFLGRQFGEVVKRKILSKTGKFSALMFFSKWRNGLHPRSPGDLTTFWSNYIRFQVVTIGIQLT